MTNFKSILFILLLLLITGIYNESLAQNFNGINFQGLIIENNQAAVDQEVFLKFSLFNQNSEIEYEEEQIRQTNIIGIVTAVIGNGISTGNGSVENILEVDWNEYPFNIEVSYKFNVVDEYLLLDDVTLNSVVYAYQALYAANEDAELNDFFDIELIDSIPNGYVLKFADSTWVVKPEAKTSLNTANALNSFYSDTAYSAFVIEPFFYYRDSVLYSFRSDSISYALSSFYSDFSNESSFTDSTFYAQEILNSLDLQGTNGNIVIGSVDSVSYSIVTNDQKRIKLKSEGNMLFNDPTDSIGFAINIKDGFLISTNVALNGLSDFDQIENALYWKANSRSFHIGSSELYNMADSGLYALSGGYLSKANSYSIGWGENCRAIGNNVVVFGKNSKATSIGINQFATGIAIGDSCLASVRSVALGNRAQSSSGSTNIVIGSNVQSSGSTSLNLGSNINSQSLTGSTAIGRSISSSNISGNFTYADSHDQLLSINSDNRFTALAGGGFLFYTDTIMNNGVELNSGSGSWSSVSSVYKKQNSILVEEGLAGKLINNLNIYSWNYKTQPAVIKHIGPISNDLVNNGLFSLQKINNFYGLTASDMDGLVLLSIKYVNSELDEISNKIKLSKEVKIESIDLSEINSRISELEKKYLNE